MRFYLIDEFLRTYNNINLHDYFDGYLRGISAESVLVEEPYIDKGYLIDFSLFHARSHKAPDRFTKRYHFFSTVISEQFIEDTLITGNEDNIKLLQESYLGFFLELPLKNKDDEKLIGRTIIGTYPDLIGTDHRSFIKTEHHVSLYGIPLNISSLPFITQDQAVSACATASLWVANYALNALFGNVLLSPAEITKIASEGPGLSRVYPSQGLNVYQLHGFFHSIGLEVELIDVKPERIKLEDIVKAYINCNLPILASIKITRDDDSEGHHAAVITGYKSNYKGEVKKLFIHDDQIGPYSAVEPNGSFKNWISDWTKKPEYKDSQVERVLIPIYHKLRLSFGRIYSVFDNFRSFQNKNAPDFLCDLLLYQINNYREHILHSSLSSNKKDIITEFMPRFLWVIRISFEGELVRDVIYDGTHLYPKVIGEVNYVI